MTIRWTIVDDPMDDRRESKRRLERAGAKADERRGLVSRGDK